MTTTEEPAALARTWQSVVRFPAGGRGVLVPGGFILTAARCVGWSTAGGRVAGGAVFTSARDANDYPLVLGVLAIEPVSGVAVLGRPDPGLMGGEAQAFDRWAAVAGAVPVAWQLGLKGGPAVVWVSDAAGRWAEGKIEAANGRAVVQLAAGAVLDAATLGGPVVSPAGEVVAVVTEAGGRAGKWGVCHGRATLVRQALPVWVVEAIAAGGSPL